MAAASSGSGGSAAVREVLTPQQRSKLDAGPDRAFYSMPRIVHHLDAGFRAQLTELYRQRIPPQGAVFDLCASWVSHLPAEGRYSRVVGQGMNAQELARNPQVRRGCATGAGLDDKKTKNPHSPSPTRPPAHPASCPSGLCATSTRSQTAGRWATPALTPSRAWRACSTCSRRSACWQRRTACSSPGARS